VLRGLVMIVMALDHVRDYFGTAANPTDVTRATAALFFTRWVTHFCAPTFFLLTGIGACLSRQRRTTGDLARFLLTRGLWLILLELTVLRCLGYQFNADYRVTGLVILWALGWSMIVLSALVHLGPSAVLAVGSVLIVSHNLFDGITPSSLGTFGPLWLVLHAQGVLGAGRSHVFFVAYPLVPWIGVTAAGYGLGPLFSLAPAQRRRTLVVIGTVLTIAFLLLRLTNVYGDPAPWRIQPRMTATWLSFLNTTKYPPSLLFLLMTLGPALIVLAALQKDVPRVLGPALTFGRVPLFYFMLHLPLIHLLAVVVCLLRYHDAHWMFESPGLEHYPFTRPPGWGYSLPVVYAVWTAVVVLLYPACRWFARVRQRRRDWWLSYL
jgi:uncharacterized membrane protein